MDPVDKRLGRYNIIRLIAEGSIGSVYQAHDPSLQRDVAVKLIPPRFARQPGFRERFPQTVRGAIDMDHSGLINVYDFGQHRDQLYIVMEYIPGANVRKLLDELIQERKWLPLHEAVLLVEQLSQTLEYTRQHGMLDLDIKPANLMLKEEPFGGLPFRVVLTDLGLSRLLEGQGISLDATVLGAPAYMSPEGALGLETDARSNVYSLGILLYELAVGLLPFPVMTVSEAVRYHTTEQPPAPRSIRPDLPEALERVILKALEKGPDRRYQSAAELGSALTGTFGDIAGVTSLNSGQERSLLTKYEESLNAPLEEEPAVVEGASDLGKTEFQPSIAPSPAASFPKMRIEVLSTGKKPQVYTFQAETVTIGRDQDNQLVIIDAEVSRHHARITWDSKNYYVTDLKSKNGTYLENRRLSQDIPIVWRPGQELRVGGSTLRLIPLSPPEGLVKDIETNPLEMAISPQQLTVEPGGSVTATLFLLNQSHYADRISLTISGIPNGWIGSLPSHLDMMPGEQKEIAFNLHVPRTPESKAGQHAITLRVTSQRDPSQTVERKLILTVAAYSEFSADLQPPRLRAGQIGRLTITNQGNLQESFRVQFIDDTGELVFQPPQFQILLPPGRTSTEQYLGNTKPSWQSFIGGERTHAFSAKVSLGNGETRNLYADLISRGLIPVWAILTVIVLCLLFTGSAAALLWDSARKTATLEVITNGNGTVTSSPVGINCGSICSFDFEENSTVNLIAEPLSPSTFSGWSGAGCSGTGTCSVTMSEAQTITATFDLPGKQTLILSMIGTGNGTVSSSPDGINCGSICSFDFDENTTVTLTAAPASPSIFGGWSGGGCSGTEACTVIMSEIRSVIATFNLPGKQTLTVNRAGTGTGTVTSSPDGINCGSTCSFDYTDDTNVTLIANPTNPSTFGGWSGAGCSGTSLTCTVKMNAAQTVTAMFNPPASQKLEVRKAGTGTGTVSSFPVGIECGASCSFDFPFDTTVRLTANPTNPFTFGGWSGGGCSGTLSTCDVKMNAAQTVTATFNPPASQTFITSTTLNAISNTLTAGQTNIPFSGQISASPAVPDGQTIQLQIRTGGCSGQDNFSTIVTTTTTGGNGSFSSSFTAPSTAGTYGLRANFLQTANAGSDNWKQSNSNCQAITVNASVQNQTIFVTTHAPTNSQYNLSFTVAAVATSNLPVAITTTGACIGGGSGSTSIMMTSSTGTCTVHYNQQGNSSYQAALEVTESTIAQKADQKINVVKSAPTDAQNNQSFEVEATTDSGLDVKITVTSNPDNACVISNGGIDSASVTITNNTGVCTVHYNQVGDANYNPAEEKTNLTNIQN